MNCMKLAETTSSPTVQQTFLDLAKQWTRLANELGRHLYALLNALNQLDHKPTLPSDEVLSGDEVRSSDEDLSTVMPLVQ